MFKYVSIVSPWFLQLCYKINVHLCLNCLKRVSILVCVLASSLQLSSPTHTQPIQPLVFQYQCSMLSSILCETRGFATPSFEASRLEMQRFEIKRIEMKQFGAPHVGPNMVCNETV